MRTLELERSAATFLNDTRQPEVNFLHSLAVISNKFLGIRLDKGKDTEQYKWVASRLTKREEM